MANLPTIHQDNLISSLSTLFNSSEYSDLTIHCGSDVYRAHRAVICPRSAFFTAACDSGFEESTTATITLDDDDQSTVRRMLTYLYTLDYDDEDAFSAVAVGASEDTNSLATDPTSKPNVVDDATVSHCKRMNNIRVYGIAEKYTISALKDLAKDKFGKCRLPGNYIHFQETVNAVFDNTPDADSGLRDMVIRVSANAGDLAECLEEGTLAPIVNKHPNFGLRMLREVFKMQQKVKLELRKLFDVSLDIFIPDKEDSQEDVERCSTALELIQDGLMVNYLDAYCNRASAYKIKSGWSAENLRRVF